LRSGIPAVSREHLEVDQMQVDRAPPTSSTGLYKE
jgi:hypothetical protein